MKLVNYIKTVTAALFMSSVAGAFCSASALAGQTAYDGLMEPNMIVNLGSPVRGVVASVNTERSSLVNKGDTLIRLESSVEQIMVDRAKALVRTEAEIRLQEEKLSFAMRSLERMNDLYESAAISPQAKDKAETEAVMARCVMQKAKEQQMLDEMELKRVQALLDLHTIKSPISGVVMELYVSPGEFIDEQPLLKLAEIDPLKVEVILPANLFGTVEVGQQAVVTPEIQAAGEHVATVTIVDKVMDASSSTFGVRLMLPNPGFKLPGGQRCTVSFVSVDVTAAPDELPAAIDLEPYETEHK